MQLFKKILCPVDFSPFSEAALRYAVSLTRENQAQLIVNHSVPEAHLALLYADAQYMGAVEDALKKKSEELLSDFVLEKIPPDVPFKTEITMGNPSDEILKLAKLEGIDLIVMGTHGHSGFDAHITGSVTNKVLHRADVPVLVICKPKRDFLEEDAGKPIQIGRILCPIDFESNNTGMVPLALTIARWYQSDLDFFHVVQKSDGISWPDQETYCLEKLRELVKPEKEEWCTVGFLLKHGNISDSILKVAEEGNVNLIIMGHHGRTPVEEFFLGSVTRKIIANAGAPVLVVRSPAQKPLLLLSYL